MPQRTGRPPGLIPDGPKIKSLRVDLGLTTAQVAERIGFHAESVRRIERGGPVGDVFASRLAKVLGVKVEDIATPPGDDDEESDPEPRALASLDTKKGPAAVNDRAGAGEKARSKHNHQ